MLIPDADCRLRSCVCCHQQWAFSGPSNLCMARTLEQDRQCSRKDFLAPTTSFSIQIQTIWSLPKTQSLPESPFLNRTPWSAYWKDCGCRSFKVSLPFRRWSLRTIFPPINPYTGETMHFITTLRSGQPFFWSYAPNQTHMDIPFTFRFRLV